jgi:hypothetical protein
MEDQPEDARGRVAAHQLPPVFVGTLFACLLGGMVPGIYMTLVAAPGYQGSPVYGLLLPWSLLPFMLATAAGWVGRNLPEGRLLRFWAVVAAVLGVVVYTYYMLFHPRGVRNVQVFLYLPLWQWLMMARAMMRSVLAWRRELRSGGGEAGSDR